MAYSFGAFTLDPGTRRLLRGTDELHLSPKAFDLLQLLIDDRRRAVPRTELHQRLWPATFVLETNLASLVAEVRRALEDSADDPQFVRTVHRVGYWFIGRINDDGVEAAAKPRTTRYWLVWETRQVALNDGENIIGRAPDASVWIDAAGVSRHHARILAGAVPTIEAARTARSCRASRSAGRRRSTTETRFDSAPSLSPFAFRRRSAQPRRCHPDRRAYFVQLAIKKKMFVGVSALTSAAGSA